ncbi:MAG: 3'-5' exoribonuclease [Anaerolineae bacterium]|nr:3'-5' exoribonuclease [Anaerolineae bacterium]
MRDVIVAIDLETTGLDANTAEIIEIGAVKFQGENILETFSTLVDPGTAIPARITSITGIRQEDLIGAPKLPAVLPRLNEFVGDALLLGHNVEFDLKFLNRAGVLKSHRAIDTYELASVLLPGTPRYNLNALMQELQLEPEGSYHRALADSFATARVYMTLWQRLQAVPVALLQEIVTITQNLPWRGVLPFQEALAIRAAENVTLPTTATLFTAPAPANQRQNADDRPSDPLPSADSAVAQAVSEALSTDRHLILEIDPAYERLGAALNGVAAWQSSADAEPESEDRVLVATSSGDLGTAVVPTAATAYLKGREHYLCPARVQTLRQRLPTSVEEVRVLAKILCALHLHGEAAGDRDHVSLRGPAEYGAWARLSAQDENCTIERCQAELDGICPFFHARQKAEDAQTIVVDHGLMIADAEAGSPVLPDYSQVIVDDAHALEEAATRSLRWRVDADAIKIRLADMGTGQRGLLGNVISSLKDSLSPQVFEQLNRYIATVASTISKMDHHVDALFKTIYSFLEGGNYLSNSEFVVYTRLSQALREKSAFGPVHEALSILDDFMDGITIALHTISRQLTTLRSKYTISDLEPLISGTRAAAHYLETLRSDLKACLNNPRENTTYWIEFSRDNFRLSLHAAPIQIGGLIREHLWESKRSVVLMGSTLRTGGSFGFIRERLGAAEDRVAEQVISSTIDWQQTTAIFLPTDMPEPAERDKYQRALERAIIELASVTNGRLLGLFTSFTQLRQSAQNIAARLALGDITVFDQSDGTSEQVLLESFRAAERGVLLGGRQFWDGAAFTAEELAAVVITRLPFAVPSDPLVAARSESADDSFNDYMIPDAILRYRQAFNRLPHVPAQRSMFVILDRRMTSKDYGRLFLESLPPCTIIKAPLADLTAESKAWFGSH